MSKAITFSYEGNDYTLAFTKRSVKKMEQQGFKVSDIGDSPMTTLPEMFAGAFIANHPFVKREKIDEIYSCLTDKQGLVGKLAELYNDTLESLFDEPEESKKVEWGANW